MMVVVTGLGPNSEGYIRRLNCAIVVYLYLNDIKYYIKTIKYNLGIFVCCVEIDIEDMYY